MVPVMTTEEPTGPLVGAKPVMAGGVPPNMSRSLVDIAVGGTEVVTEIFPLIAPLGTVTVSAVAVAEETAAAIPLILTVLLAETGSKFVPVTVIVEPGA